MFVGVSASRLVSPWPHPRSATSNTDRAHLPDFSGEETSGFRPQHPREYSRSIQAGSCLNRGCVEKKKRDEEKGGRQHKREQRDHRAVFALSLPVPNYSPLFGHVQVLLRVTFHVPHQRGLMSLGRRHSSLQKFRCYPLKGSW